MEERTGCGVEFTTGEIFSAYCSGAEWADKNSNEDRIEAQTMLSNLDIFNRSVSRDTSSLDTETLMVNTAIEKCQRALQNIVLSQKYTTYEVDRESDADNIIVRGYLYVKKKQS